MSLDKYKVKFKKNSNEICGDAPQYSITYKSDLKNASSISHEIISAFIGKSDVIVEINSDMSGIGPDRSNSVDGFIGKTGAFNLSYRMRNVQSEKNSSAFGFVLDLRKKKQAKEALIHIPNAVWNHPAFGSCLPLHGARYYVAKESDDFSGRLEKIECMSLSDKADVFKAVIFDLAICGQMGISSAFLTMDEIKGMLGS